VVRGICTYVRKVKLLLTGIACSLTLQVKGQDAPGIKSAGIDIQQQNHYLIRWDSDSKDPANINHYKIEKHKKNTTTFETIGTANKNSTSYIDATTACCESEAFAVSTVRNDGSIPSTSDFFKTMFLKTPVLDECTNSMSLSWSNYQKLDKFEFNPIASFEANYHIYGYIGGTQLKPDSVEYFGSSGTNTSFVINNVVEQKYHHYYIAAVYNNGADTSYSNIQATYVNLPLRPKYISIDSVIMSQASTIIRFSIDTDTEYTKFSAEKSNDKNGPFLPFETISDKSNDMIEHTISSAQRIYYRISAVNSCGNVTFSSPTVASLQVQVGSRGTKNLISWNDIEYNGYQNAVYNVKRTEPKTFMANIGNTSSTSIADDLSTEPTEIIGQTTCYEVRANVQDENSINIFHAKSAPTCHTITPDVYMPNALRPNSYEINPDTKNSRNLFKPVSAFDYIQDAEPGKYFTFVLRVYDRWSKEIYSGSEAWNGRYSNTGNFVDGGNYYYHIWITFANGNKIEKTGYVTVVY
jgi:hypothetical protein